MKRRDIKQYSLEKKNFFGEGTFLRRKFRKLFTMLSAVVLVLSMYLIPANGQAATIGNNAQTSLKVNEAQLQQKIGKSLLKSFETEEQVKFLVKLKDQVDTEKVAALAQEKAKAKNLSAFQTKHVTRSTVITELKANANTTQKRILDFAEKEKAKGNVSEIESFYIVNAVAIKGTKEVMEKIASFEEVEKVLLDEKRKVIQTEIDVSQQIENAIQSIEWNIDRVKAPDAWALGYDGSGVTVAIIDTGVQWDHPTLKDKYLGYNAETGEVNHEIAFFDAVNGQTAAYDDHGHGTHVTGTIVGSSPDGSNQIGVAPGAKFIAAKAIASDGYGYNSDFISAGQWVMDQGADVVNNSWGGGPGIDEFFRPMVQSWRSVGILPVFAAGNTDLFTPQEPGTVASPANYPESFAVGATDSNDELANFSLLGPSPYGELKPEVSAPGVSIRSSYPNNSFAGASGTSMAAPHVAGVAALVLQANSSLDVGQLEDVLMATAVPRTNADYPESPNNAFGHGIVDALAAVTSVADGVGQVEGTVTVEGEDTEAPIIEFDDSGELYAGLKSTFYAEIHDDISIVDVVFEYEKDGETIQLTPTKVAGDYKGGTYAATVPGEDIVEGTFHFTWKATDFGGNEAAAEGSITVLAAPSVGYFNDFETNINGWNTDTPYAVNNSWEWGEPTSGPGEAYSGSKLWATNLDGNYLTDSYSTLETPPIYIPEEGALLQFAHWYHLENNWDFAYLTITDDGGDTWWLIEDYTGQSGGWQTPTFDLSEYAGSTVIISFDLEGDWLIEYPGWYMDDFAILPVNDNSASLKGKGTIKKAGKVEKFDKQKMNNGTKKNTATFETEDATIQGLPIGATVTVKETGLSTMSDPATGAYSLMHSTGQYTIVAEAYGYYPAEQSVNIMENEVTVANFLLEELPKGTIKGTVINDQTGNPIEGATVYLVEDANIEPVQTNENGEFEIVAYEGEYTLKVVASYYFGEEISVTLDGGSEVDVSVNLKPFVGYPGDQIGYDDGTVENAIAWNSAGNGWGVQMSLKEGANRALVTGASIYFYDSTWPVPGGDDIQVAVYDATGEGGAPGNLLAGPFDAKANRDGTWTYIDLSDKGIVVDGDFYIVYIQTTAYPNSPGIGLDESSTDQRRSWEYFGGEWTPSYLGDFPGNYMIRAHVAYELSVPQITSPSDGQATNQSTITVEGIADPAGDVALFNNGLEVARVTANEAGHFQANVNLEAGENVITARGVTEHGMTDESNSVHILLDQQAPSLTVTSPEDGLKTNKEVVTVTGTVSDDYGIANVTVNGQAVNVNDGEFSHRIILDEGRNEITVIAADLAGNEAIQVVTVDAKFGDIEVTNIQPSEDVHLSVGESVTISFESEEGLTAYYSLKLPLLSGAMGVQANATVQFEEVSPGYYEAVYTAPHGVIAGGVEIEITVMDDYGNVSRYVADGKLDINTWSPRIPPITRIAPGR